MANARDPMYFVEIKQGSGTGTAQEETHLWGDLIWLYSGRGFVVSSFPFLMVGE